MGAIHDNLELEIATLRNYLRADPMDDVIIEKLFNSAKAEADRICNNSFADKDGNVEIPPDVEQWVYEIVAYRYQRRAGGIKAESADGVGRIEWEKPNISVLLRHRKNPGL